MAGKCLYGRFPVFEMSHWLVLVERLHGPDLASKTTNEIAYDYPLEIGLKPEPSDIPKARDSL